MGALRKSERCRDSAERSARRRNVSHKYHISRSPVGGAARREQKRGRLQFSQKIDLILPKRLPIKQKSCFVPTHPARFASGQQNRTQAHLTGVAARPAHAVEWSWPSERIRARNPPFPF